VLGERVSGRLWVGFDIVWVALVLLGVDSLRTANASRTERRRVADDTTGTARLGSARLGPRHLTGPPTP